MFDKALTVMTCFYASPLTFVVQHRCLPPRPGQGWDSNPYHKSGWCCMEQASALLKQEGGIKLYDLTSHGLRPRRLDANERAQFEPQAMSTFFLDEERSIFMGRADREMVSNMYRDFHTSMKAFDEQHQRCLARVAERMVGQISDLASDLAYDQASARFNTLVMVGLLFFIILPYVPAHMCIFNITSVNYAHANLAGLWLPVLWFGLLVTIVCFPFASATYRSLVADFLAPYLSLCAIALDYRARTTNGAAHQAPTDHSHGAASSAKDRVDVMSV